MPRWKMEKTSSIPSYALVQGLPAIEKGFNCKFTPQFLLVCEVLPKQKTFHLDVKELFFYHGPWCTYTQGPNINFALMKG